VNDISVCSELKTQVVLNFAQDRDYWVHMESASNRSSRSVAHTHTHTHTHTPLLSI